MFKDLSAGILLVADMLEQGDTDMSLLFGGFALLAVWQREARISDFYVYVDTQVIIGRLSLFKER